MSQFARGFILHWALRLGGGFLVVALLLASAAVRAERIKDLATVQGLRSNALVGYGLVVGLNGTGDQTSQAPFTVQSLKATLQQLGVTIPPNVNPQLKNVAAVALSAELPAFAKPGQKIDVTVSSIANAGSLRGGALLMAPLRGADGEVYALAQGNLVVGGLGVDGKDGSRVSINIPSDGRIPGGATIERAAPTAWSAAPEVRLNLHRPDATTAARLAAAVNARLGEGTAIAQDPMTVAVRAPAEVSLRTGYIAEVENIELDPGEAPARVIINSRTGTVVISQRVQVRPAAVAHGALSVTITERRAVSQPNAFSDGKTVDSPLSSIAVEQGGSGRMFKFEAGVSLDEIVRAVNQVGAAPGDLVAILEALREAGALRAELVVI
jgi:flagellar P-ring protein precursor FlgI